MNIGNFIGINNTMNNFTKLIIIKGSNVPNDDSPYPYSIHCKQGNQERWFLRKNTF